jgi:hypothetical protein
VQSVVLVNGNSTQCRSCAQRDVSVGDRFDRLTVVGYSNQQYEQGRARAMVDCRCDCGGLVSIRVGVLRQNKTNNCGCAPRGAWSGVGEISSTFYNRQARRASERGLVFDVSHDFLWEIYIKQGRQCALSGLPIRFSQRTAGRNTASLDRIDSSRGYTEDNVQWTHRDINRMKLDHSVDAFIDLCRKVTEHAASGILQPK